MWFTSSVGLYYMVPPPFCRRIKLELSLLIPFNPCQFPSPELTRSLSTTYQLLTLSSPFFTSLLWAHIFLSPSDYSREPLILISSLPFSMLVTEGGLGDIHTQIPMLLVMHLCSHVVPKMRCVVSIIVASVEV